MYIYRIHKHWSMFVFREHKQKKWIFEQQQASCLLVDSVMLSLFHFNSLLCGLRKAWEVASSFAQGMYKQNAFNISQSALALLSPTHLPSSTSSLRLLLFETVFSKSSASSSKFTIYLLTFSKKYDRHSLTWLQKRCVKLETLESKGSHQRHHNISLP